MVVFFIFSGRDFGVGKNLVQHPVEGYIRVLRVRRLAKNKFANTGMWFVVRPVNWSDLSCCGRHAVHVQVDEGVLGRCGWPPGCKCLASKLFIDG